MKKPILVAGAAALIFGTSAFAKPDKGQGGHSKAHAAKAHGKAHATKTHGRHVVVTRTGGRLYAFGARGSCPPGLAKKGNGCMPPGQAKKKFNIGQRYDRNSGNLWSYNQIPYDLRSRYDFDRNDRFYYNNGYVYQVDARTSLVQQAVSALLR
ncbi:MAG: hypothetical protein M3Q19_11070 [Pseudomonadota bacterium]|nr:hypothetical protein [Pseudomonadota bacterium]